MTEKPSVQPYQLASLLRSDTLRGMAELLRYRGCIVRKLEAAPNPGREVASVSQIFNAPVHRPPTQVRCGVSDEQVCPAAVSWRLHESKAVDVASADWPIADLQSGLRTDASEL